MFWRLDILRGKIGTVDSWQPLYNQISIHNSNIVTLMINENMTYLVIMSVSVE